MNAMTTLTQDLRYAARGLAKSRGFGGVAVAVTAVVVAACARPARRAMAADPAAVLRSE